MNFTKDEETIIRKMAENDMNITEVARQMFVHRNTLIYRIEKIKKKTGLDIRKFYDLYDALFAIAWDKARKPGVR